MIRWIFFGALLVSSVAFSQVVVPQKYRTAAPKPTAVVARVNGQAITAAEVEPYLWDWLAKGALDDMMSYVLVGQDAAKHGIVIADNEVDKSIQDEIAAVQKSRGGTIDDAYSFLKEQGFTKSRLFVRLRTTLLVDKLVASNFHPENQVKVATILVRTPSADAASVAAAIKKCQDAYDQLKAGKAWDTVLAATSSETNLVTAHGELGWRDLSMFPQSVQDELKGLKVGEFTRPAQTQFGIQIFRVDSHGQDAKGDELANLKAAYVTAARPKYMSDLKAKSKIEVLMK